MSVTIKFRRGTASEWVANGSTVLASGEPGYEIDSGRFKIGNGIVAWSGLPYASVIPSGFIAGSGINVGLGTNGSTATISVSGLNSSYISDFNEAVDDRIGSGLFVAGTGINLTYNDGGNSFTVSVTGLVSNPANNRVLTSRDSSTTGIDAESNLTFDGSLLTVGGNLIANTGTLDILQFNTNNGLVSAQGQMGWNTTQGTVDVALTSTAIIELGEHQMYRVRNTTSNTLYRGQPVYASGVHSNGLITPNLYLSDGSIDEIRFIGLMYETVNNNNNGYVIAFGHMYNIDTRGNVASDIAVGDETWANGDILYPHPTVAGKLTKVPPKHYIPIALILDAASNGKLYVRRDLGAGELDDLHNVNVSGVTNGQFLQYNSSTDYWVPSSSGNFTTLLVNGTGVSINGHTHSSSNITDFTEAVQDVVGASGFLVGVSGITLSYDDIANTLTITGGGAGTTITNAGDNRILTSDGTSTGINAESNFTFDGTNLVIASGDATIGGLKALKWNGNTWGYDRIIFRSDVNNKITSDANGHYNWLVAGRNWTLSDVANVGIGTSSPLYKMDIVLSANSETGFRLSNNNTGSSTRTNVILSNDQGYEAGFSLGGTGVGNNNFKRPNRAYLYSPFILDYVSGQHIFWVGGGGVATDPSGATNIGTWNSTALTVNNSIQVDNLNLDSNTISSTNTNGNIVLAPNGTGDVQVDADTLRVGDSNSAATITTNGTGNLILNTNSGTNSGNITIAQGTNGNITITPNGTGDVQVDSDTLRVGDSNAAATITTNGTGNLTISTNSGTNSGSIVINQGSNGNIAITPNGTGEVDLSKVDIDGGSIDNTIIGANSAASGKFTQLYPTVVSNGTVSGNVSTNVANGQIFDMTVSGATTLSNPTNAVDGVTVRWRIRQDGTGGHSVSLDTEFQIPSSASSPLPWSTAANAMDILAATYHAGRGKWDVVAFVPGY